MDEINYIIEEYTGNTLAEPEANYGSAELNALTYRVIGACMEVHSTLGKGFLEGVYKDCLKIEFDKRAIFFQTEKKFEIVYKGITIPHYYYADFVIEDQVVVEIKAQGSLADANVKQLLNYLAASKCKIGLLINFGEDALNIRRVVLSK